MCLLTSCKFLSRSTDRCPTLRWHRHSYSSKCSGLTSAAAPWSIRRPRRQVAPPPSFELWGLPRRRACGHLGGGLRSRRLHVGSGGRQELIGWVGLGGVFAWGGCVARRGDAIWQTDWMTVSNTHCLRAPQTKHSASPLPCGRCWACQQLRESFDSVRTCYLWIPILSLPSTSSFTLAPCILNQMTLCANICSNGCTSYS